LVSKESMEENINEVDTLEKGDLLVEHGEIYQVVSVKDQKNFKGETEAFIMYKPYFETYRNKSLLRSTPLSSLGLTSLRKPIDQSEVDEILTMITTHPGPGSQFNQKSARDVLNSNAISKIAEIIQLIWAEQLGDDKDLSLTKKDL